MNTRVLIASVGILVLASALFWWNWFHPHTLLSLANPPPIPTLASVQRATPTDLPPTPTILTAPPTSAPSPTAEKTSRNAVALVRASHAVIDPTQPSEESTPSATATSVADTVETDPSVAAVPILMYHYIRVNPVASDVEGFNLSITPQDFAAQVQWLAENGFHTVTVAQVRDWVRNGTPLPPKPIALTFDDGYDDAYSAARPVLAAYHMTGTFFIITGFVNQPRYLNWDQVVSLDHQGFEIGSHTVHHLGLPYISIALRRFELVNSRSTLEGHLGHSVLDFCYPSGEVNGPTEQSVTQAGYLAATTTQSGFARRGDDPLRLPRLRIYGGMTLGEYAYLLGHSGPIVSVPAPAAKRVAPRPTMPPTPRPSPSPSHSPTPNHAAPSTPTPTPRPH